VVDNNSDDVYWELQMQQTSSSSLAKFSLDSFGFLGKLRRYDLSHDICNRNTDILEHDFEDSTTLAPEGFLWSPTFF
jgi:hypothetical protein